MSAVILLIPAPAWARVLVVVTLGGISVMLAVITLSRNPALRVDATGVTIRPYTLPASTILSYPWEDVVQFVIIRAEPTGQSLHIGLREGAQFSALSRLTASKAQRELALAGRPSGNTYTTLQPPGIVMAVNGWTLHPARLAAAVAHFAPTVRVIDGATGSVINPAQT
jgi:hypothetical protein